MIATIVLLGVIYMGQVSQAAIIGQRVHDKQDRLERLHQENVQLEADIAALISPDKIEARAKALGLRIAKPDQIKYVVLKDYPAELVQATPAPISISTATVSKSGIAAWWAALLARLGLDGSAHAAEATTP